MRPTLWNPTSRRSSDLTIDSWMSFAPAPWRSTTLARTSTQEHFRPICSNGITCPLLPYARETGLDGIEAITPQPQGDVTLKQVRDALGDQMVLLDGIPAVYFDDTYEIEVLEACVHELIELFAPRLVLGISDEISSTGDLKRVRRVGEIVAEYNATSLAGQSALDPGGDP